MPLNKNTKQLTLSCTNCEASSKKNNWKVFTRENGQRQPFMASQTCVRGIIENWQGKEWQPIRNSTIKQAKIGPESHCRREHGQKYKNTMLTTHRFMGLHTNSFHVCQQRSQLKSTKTKSVHGFVDDAFRRAAPPKAFAGCGGVKTTRNDVSEQS